MTITTVLPLRNAFTYLLRQTRIRTQRIAKMFRDLQYNERWTK